MKKILVVTLVGKNAISMSSGGKLFNQIEREIKVSGKVQLDFNGVELFASPFFNSSVGLMLKDLTIEQLKERIEIVNLNEVGLDLLNLVIDNAIKFYSSSENIEKAIDNVKKDRDI